MAEPRSVVDHRRVARPRPGDRRPPPPRAGGRWSPPMRSPDDAPRAPAGAHRRRRPTIRASIARPARPRRPGVDRRPRPERSSTRSGAPDGVVHNAGIAGVGCLEEMPDADVGADVLDQLLRPGAPHPGAAAGDAGRRPGPDRRWCRARAPSGACPAIGAYSAAKGALERWAESLSPEIAPFGLGVTVLVAGTLQDRHPRADPDLRRPRRALRRAPRRPRDQRPPVPALRRPARAVRARGRPRPSTSAGPSPATASARRRLLLRRQPPAARRGCSSAITTRAVGIPGPARSAATRPAASVTAREPSRRGVGQRRGAAPRSVLAGEPRAPRGPSLRTMFSGIHSSSNSDHARMSADGPSTSELARPDALRQQRLEVAQPRRERRTQVGRVRRRLPDPGELDVVLVAEPVDGVDVDPHQRVELLDDGRIRLQHAAPARPGARPRTTA